jgi:hypothetical protein
MGVNCLFGIFVRFFVDLEEEMKRLLTVLVAGLLIAAFAVPAFAWEFSMTGEYEYRLRYLSRTGDTDLFGVAPIQDAVGTGAPAGQNAVGFAGPNWYNSNMGNTRSTNGIVGARVTEWPFNPADPHSNIVVRHISSVTAGFADTGAGRARIVRGGYSTFGCDALYADSRLTLRPVIRVNPAIRVHGVYTVGGMRHKYFQNYIGGFGIGIGTTPLERYYMSQTSDNAYDTAALGSWEQFRATIQTPFGIWSIGVKDFPFGIGASLAYNTRAESFLTVVPYGPFRFLYAVWLARNVPNSSWATHPDKDQKADFFEGGAVTYDCGGFSFGYLILARNWHGSSAYSPALGTDQNLLNNIAFFKYNNGRVFAAAEYSWTNLDQHFIGARPFFGEGYHFASEAGGVAGPAKLRLMYSQASGPVLNSGNPTKAYLGDAVNYQFLAPYQFLMFETYAGGNDSFQEDHGNMSDAYCFAARADYAVASNLNVWASYIWAHRLEQNGYWKGGKASDGSVAGAALRNQFLTTNYGGNNGINPYVDDGYLGWEGNVGVDWKLLEGLNMFVRYSYWQPGDWFDQAYQAVGFVNGTVPNSARSDGTGLQLPIARVTGRDAIHAIQGSFMVNF